MNSKRVAFQRDQDSVGLVHPQHFFVPGKPTREYFSFVPAETEGTTPLVVVHGISRNAAQLILRFSACADSLKVPIIAPLYRKAHYGMYQQVVDPRRGHRADDALFDILDDAAARWSLKSDRFDLFGFSGGGQFAHRFALLHPHRLLSCIPVSSGWYSWPDDDLFWPVGLRQAPIDQLDAAAVRSLPIHVVVGDRDRHSDEALRRSDEIDSLQGTDRVERARRWCHAMKSCGLNPNCSLTLLPGAKHSFSSADRHGLVKLVFRLLGHSIED